MLRATNFGELSHPIWSMKVTNLILRHQIWKNQFHNSIEVLLDDQSTNLLHEGLWNLLRSETMKFCFEIYPEQVVRTTTYCKISLPPPNKLRNWIWLGIWYLAHKTYLVLGRRPSTNLLQSTMGKITWCIDSGGLHQLFVGGRSPPPKCYLYQNYVIEHKG